MQIIVVISSTVCVFDYFY